MANMEQNTIRCKVAGTSPLLLLAFFSFVLSFVPAVESQTATSVQIDVISVYPKQEYDDALKSETNAAFVALNTSSCSDIQNAVSSAGNLLTCSVDHFEPSGSGVKAVINITVELGSKTADDLYIAIRTAIVTAASQSTTWDVTEGDVTLVEASTPPPPATIDVTMKVMSKRYDLTYDQQLSDASQFVYRTQTNTMCADITNALDSIASINSCEVDRFEAISSGGLKAFMKVKITVTGKDEQDGFLNAGRTLVEAAAKEERWDVVEGDIILVPSQKPPINPTTTFSMTLLSTRTDLTLPAESNDTETADYSHLNATMCDDVVEALFYTAIVHSCKANNFTSANPGVKAQLTLDVGIEADTAVNGFLITSQKILSESEKRQAWIINAADIKYIKAETVTTASPPRSASSRITQLPLVSLLTFALIQLIGS